MPRSIFTDPAFADEPLTEREAFISLVADANYKPSRLRLRGGAVELQRGQLLASTRFLAARWRWQEPRVRRFLNRLSGRRANDATKDAKNDAHIDAHIDTQPTPNGTIITVRNYDRFQKASKSPDDRSHTLPGAQSDARNDAAPDFESTQREEGIKTNNSISVPSERVLAPPADSVTPIESRKAQLAERAATPAGVLFTHGVNYLEIARGMPTQKARQIIGMWRKNFSDGEIIDAISSAQREEAEDPVAFIAGYLKSKNLGTKSGGTMSAIAALEVYR
jgi:hypothetical protein